jgi:uncharacterized protein YbaP (TraB family)
MFRKVLVCWFLICNAWIAKAQAPFEKSLLWEISHKTLPAPSYLFGTIHLICQDDFAMPDSLKAFLRSSGQLVLEVDMDDPGLMAAMTKTMFMPENRTLSNLLNADDYTRLNRFYQDSLDMDIRTFDKAKPFVMMGPLFNKILNCTTQSYEMELMNLAKQRNLEVLGVETIEEQMAVFDTIPYHQQAQMLLAIIDSIPTARAEFGELTELYKKADLPALYALTIKSKFGMDSEDELMLFRRNQKWISRIEALISNKPSFIAVGAAHLGGARGVISLLRKKGYTVRAISH